MIPFVDASVTAAELRRAIVEEYHYAILSGQLEVELDDDGVVEQFTADHVPAIGAAAVNAQVTLARWAVSQSGGELRTIAPPPGQVQRLNESLVTVETRDAVAVALDRTPAPWCDCNSTFTPGTPTRC